MASSEFWLTWVIDLSAMPAHSSALLQAALIGYQSEINRIQEAMAAIRAELKGSGGTSATPTAEPRKRSRFSAASRKKMAAAQRARWAKIRAEKAKS
jgi:hypothetical protein